VRSDIPFDLQDHTHQYASKYMHTKKEAAMPSFINLILGEGVVSRRAFYIVNFTHSSPMTIPKLCFQMT